MMGTAIVDFRVQEVDFYDCADESFICLQASWIRTMSAGCSDRSIFKMKMPAP